MAPFDPYHKWLAIPLEEQPPNNYRLLGLPLFEADADVIETAAERQTLLLRTFQTGPNAELAERLLNEVSEARVCLLDGKSKARYDTQLRATLEPEDDPLGFTPEELAPVASRASTRQRSRGGKPFWQEPWAIPAAAGGIVVVLLLIMLIFGSGEEPKESGQGQEQELEAEIASLKEKLVAAGNSKVVPTASEVTAKSLPASLQEGLVAYYPFNGNANDESGNGNHGTNPSVVFSADRYGNPDNALAPEQKLIVSDDVDFRIGHSNPREFSVALWCYLKDRSATFKLYKTRAKISSSSVDWNLYQTATGGLVWGTGPSAAHKGGSSRSSWQMTAFRALPNRWTLVTATYFNRGDEKRKQVYINGELIDENVIGKKNIGSDSQLVIETSIGAILDDIRIYNRALSEQEVRQLYEFESVPTSAESKTKTPLQRPKPLLYAISPFDSKQAVIHQAEWAKHLGIPVEYTNSIGMKFMLIPPGEFMMGAVDGQSGNLRYRNRDAPNTPSHLVKITRAFYLGATEVTRGQWGQLNANTFNVTDSLPVNRVNYHAVTQFANELSEREKTGDGPTFASPPTYRLPTEAEWEYAARAGTIADHFAGNTIEAVAKYEWTKATSFLRLKPVGTKLPNPWRLFDVGGNLNEWCLNRGSHTFFKKNVLTIDPQGPQEGDRRALRSGTTHYDQFPLWRINTLPPSVVDDRHGFRVLLEIPNQ